MRPKMNLIAVSVALIVVAFGGRALGQFGDQPYRLSDRDVERLIRNVEKQADNFRKSLDAALDKSRLNNTRREDDINAFVKEFDQETKRLHDHFDSHKSTTADIQSVLDRAARIDRFMSRNRLNARAQNDWSGLRANLDQLARAYNVDWRWGGYSDGPPLSDVPYRLNDKDVERIMRNIERQSDRFRSSLDSALDKSRLNNTRREDEINAFVKEFYKETKRLRDHFDSHKSTSADVQSVLDRAARIDEFMRRRPLTREAQNEWSALKTNLDELARAYNVSWNWYGSGSGSGPVPVDRPVVAIITSSGSTNYRAFRISLTRDGRAEVARGNSLETRYLPTDLADRFFADLAAAMPLYQLPVEQPCIRSVSFGNSIYVGYGGDRTPDLSCAAGARTMVLRDDVSEITRALNLR
jgi:predicted glycoside hydrolase/deacetylase ChbG (UPF0249 family)